MSKVAIDRAVVEQAMKAMLNFPGDISDEMFESIRALRAALAGPAQEPAAYTTGHCENHKQKGGCQLHNLQCGWPDCDRKPTTAPPQQAEPAQEPAALDWLRMWANQDGVKPETQWHDGYEAARRVVQLHLGTPPQRMNAQNELDDAMRTPRAMAQAYEAGWRAALVQLQQVGWMQKSTGVIRCDWGFDTTGYVPVYAAQEQSE